MDIDVATIGMQSRWRKVVEPLTAVHNNGGNEMYKRLAILKHVFTYWGHGNGYHWAATQHMHAHQLHRRHTHTHTCFRDVAHAPVSPTSHALISSKSHVTHTLFSQMSYVHRFHRCHTHRFHRRHTCFIDVTHTSFTNATHTSFTDVTHTCFTDVTHTCFTRPTHTCFHTRLFDRRPTHTPVSLTSHTHTASPMATADSNQQQLIISDLPIVK